MFTGLIETKGLIDSFEKNEDGMILRLNHIDSFDVSINDSVSCNGAVSYTHLTLPTICSV